MESIQTKYSGNIVVPIKLVAEKGITFATIISYICGCCQQMGGVCEFSHSVIADSLHVSRYTVIEYIKQYIDEGYLLDLTPERKNREHCYRSTGKISQ